MGVVPESARLVRHLEVIKVRMEWCDRALRNANWTIVPSRRVLKETVPVLQGRKPRDEWLLRW